MSSRANREPNLELPGKELVILLVSAAVTLLASGLEGQHAGYERAIRTVQSLARDFDRVAQVPSLSSRWRVEGAHSLEAGYIVNLGPSDLDRGFRAWETAVADPDFIAFCDPSIYGSMSELASELYDLSGAVAASQMKVAPTEDWVRELAEKHEPRASFRFHIGGTKYVPRPELVRVIERKASEDGKQETITVQADVNRDGYAVTFSFTSTMEKGHDALFISTVEHTAQVLLHKIRVSTGTQQGLTRMFVKSLRARYFFLFLITYALSAAWAAACFFRRPLRPIEGTLNLAVLLLLVFLVPITDSWVRHVAAFDYLWIETGWAESIVHCVVLVFFTVYTAYYLGYRRALGLFRDLRKTDIPAKE